MHTAVYSLSQGLYNYRGQVQACRKDLPDSDCKATDGLVSAYETKAFEGNRIRKDGIVPTFT